MATPDQDWWRTPLSSLVRGRKVIVVGGVATAWCGPVETLRELGAADLLVVGTDGAGVGPAPRARTVLIERADRTGDVMAVIRASVRVAADPPAHVVAAIEEFDPTREALVFGTFLIESPSLAGRPLVAYRRPEWVALEDKTVVDGLLDRAGIVRADSRVVATDGAVDCWHALDAGSGTVWAADSQAGYHGGATLTRWVRDDADAARVTAEFAPLSRRVRVMPFLEGIPASVHGIVLPDAVAAFRPVEIVTLRGGGGLHYAGCATFWDPPTWIREQMREAARRLGALLADEVGFRGAFTLDGVATNDGFRPTELNPRSGAGMGAVTGGLGAPLPLILDLIVAGIPLPLPAAALESTILESADTRRGGGTSQLGVTGVVPAVERPVRHRAGGWAWAPDADSDAAGGDAAGADAAGTVSAGEGFVRLTLDPDRTPVGPSVAALAVDFWRFADAELGTRYGPLHAPADPFAPAPA